MAVTRTPARTFWVYDLKTRQQLQQIKLEKLSTAIEVSKDDAPLLFSVFIGSPALDIYDAVSGNYLRSVDELGLTPVLVQTP